MVRKETSTSSSCPFVARGTCPYFLRNQSRAVLRTYAPKFLSPCQAVDIDRRRLNSECLITILYYVSAEGSLNPSRLSSSCRKENQSPPSHSIFVWLHISDSSIARSLVLLVSPSRLKFPLQQVHSITFTEN